MTFSAAIELERPNHPPHHCEVVPNQPCRLSVAGLHLFPRFGGGKTNEIRITEALDTKSSKILLQFTSSGELFEADSPCPVVRRNLVEYEIGGDCQLQIARDIYLRVTFPSR